MKRSLKKNIFGKHIYIFEEHHHVLEAWAEIRKKLEYAPALISLDHHQDTIIAFNKYCWHNSRRDDRRFDVDLFKEKISQLDYQQEESINSAITDLKNDEHISAALLGDLVGNAFIFSYDHYGDHISHSKEGPNYSGEKCILSVKIDDRHLDASNEIHDDFFKGAFEKMEELSSRYSKYFNLESYLDIQRKGQYILDVDLDYFHTVLSMEPKKSTYFYSLIKKAIAITIATEPEWVQKEKIDSAVSSKMLLLSLLGHIEKALST